MNAIEQLANEIIRQRPYKAKAWKPTRRKGRFGSCRLRQLTAAEVAELQSHVEAVAKAACKAGRYCWRPNCQRCKPA